MDKTEHILKRIQAEAAQNASSLRWVRVCKEGDEIRQGDIYLYPLDQEPAHGESGADRQLAPGTTRGSRHIIEGEAEVYATEAEDVLAGPIVHALERVTLTHPEHAHVSLPAGWYEVRYQRDFEVEAADAVRIRRVFD